MFSVKHTLSAEYRGFVRKFKWDIRGFLDIVTRKLFNSGKTRYYKSKILKQSNYLKVDNIEALQTIMNLIYTIKHKSTVTFWLFRYCCISINASYEF